LLFAFDSTLFFLHYIVHYLLHFIKLFPPPFPREIPSASNHPVVLITSASNGIGHTLAVTLALEGYVVLAGVGSQADGDRLLQHFEDAKRERHTEVRHGHIVGSIRVIFLDVINPDHVRDTVRLVEYEYAADFYALISNTGVVTMHTAQDLSTQLPEVMNVNFNGPMILIQSLLPTLKRNYGRVINVGTLGAIMATPMLLSYIASKSAFKAATRCLRMELQPHQVATSLMTLGGVASGVSSEFNTEYQNSLARIQDPKERNLFITQYELINKSAASVLPSAPVVHAMRHALTAKWPKSEYLVGWDVRMVASMRWVLGEAFLDWMMQTQIRWRMHRLEKNEQQSHA